MRTLFATLIASAVLSLAPAALAGGGDEYTLDMESQVAIGDSFSACVTAPAGSQVFILVSATPGPTPTRFGALAVGLPLLTIWEFPMPAPGSICLPHLVECVPSVVGLTGYFQFVALGPAPGQFGISNMVTLTATDDGLCDIATGDYATFTQGGWGTKCAGGSPGCLRDQWFGTVFPNGLVLGDADGPDADGLYALLLTDSLAVENFLPEGSTAAVFTADAVNPTGSPAGVFSGQLTAAKLNVGFDDAGALDTLKNQVAGLLGDLVYRDCVHPMLIGKTVREVIGLADGAISGELPAPVDVNGDLVGDVSLSDLSDALDALNRNFDNGTTNNGCLKLP